MNAKHQIKVQGYEGNVTQLGHCRDFQFFIELNHMLNGRM